MTKKLNIPFSPPDITEEEIQAVAEVMRSGWITTGPRTKEFERNIAQFTGCNRAACLNSATACLETALRLLGIGEGDEVIVPAYTYTASASVVAHVNAKLVLIDVEKDTYHLDYDALEAAINESTKAVIPVDIGGVMVDYDRIRKIVESKKNIFKYNTTTIKQMIGGIKMAKMTGLGKGLDALFGPAPEEEQIKENDSLKNLKITEVEPNRDQPRKRFDQEALEELANSIKEYGLIQPIVVTKKEDYYQIIAGERRWRASKLAGMEEIPAIIREDDDKKNTEIALIENIQREDLNPYEKAVGIKNLMQEYGLRQEDVAKKLGKSRSAIANSVRILNLDPRVLEFAKEGKLTEGHCKSLLPITDPERQYKTAVQMIERGATVRQLEKAVKTKVSKEEQDRNHVLYKDIENTFQGFFGTKVRLDAGKRRGKIVIEYSSNDDLERILDLIK